MQEFDVAMSVIRVAVGLTMAAHGVNKVRGGLGGTARWFDGLGMRPGAVHARLAAAGEIASGGAMALGLLTSFAALGFVGLMAVAGWTVHRSNGFFIVKEGWEYVFVLAVVAAAIAMLGPGAWSVDRAIGIDDELDGFVGLGIALVGVVAAVGLLAVCYRPPTTSDR